MKKIFGIISAFIVISVVPAYALDVSQRWDKTYNVGGFSIDSSIQQTLDGGYILVGYDIFEGGYLVLKLNYNGDIVWQKTYGQFNAFALSGQQTADGGYIVAGWKDPGDSLVLRLDRSGAILWQKVYGGASIYNENIVQTHDGGFIMIGATHSFGEALLVIRLNAEGDISWQKKYSTTVGDYDLYKFPIKQTSDGGFIITAQKNNDFWVFKLDSTGNISWQKTYGTGEYAHPWSIDETSDGGYIVAGWTSSFGAGEADCWILKLDNNGDVIWQKTYGRELRDIASYIKQTPDGGYIVVGASDSFGVSDSLLIFKLDNSGVVSWQKIYQERKAGFQPTVGLTSDGGYVISSGSLTSEAWRIWVLKLDSNGEIPDCAVLSTTDVIVSDTTVTAEDSNVIVSLVDLIATDLNIIPQETSSSVSSICQYDDPLDTDGDGIGNSPGASFASSLYNGSFLFDQDNCPSMPNGPFLGVCSKGTVGGTCIANEACGIDGICSMNQEDSYPPEGNGIGDACDCEGNFDCDNDCDGTDASTFKVDFGRSEFNNLCESGDPCNGDFDCDGDCDGTDAAGFKFDFGRSSFNNPCPACVVGEWCSYP